MRAGRAAAIEDPDAVAEAVEGVDAIVNFAAETHVDRSIAEPEAFITTHADGHLRAARGGARARPALRAGLHRRGLRLDRGGLVHRAVAAEPRPRRTARPRPAPTCSWQSYRHTYGLEALICRGSNNYGPYQYPEKLIPLMVLNALHGDQLPVYGDGMQVRNWIYVEDFARGIGTVLERGEPGEVYNVGGPDEAPNLEVVRNDHRVHGPRRVADRVRHRPPWPRPPLLARVREGARARLGARRCASPRAWSGRSTGTATTPGGGSRSARATTARTTSASTAARSARQPPSALARQPPFSFTNVKVATLPWSPWRTCAVASSPVDLDAADLQVVVGRVGDRVLHLGLAIAARALELGEQLLGEDVVADRRGVVALAGLRQPVDDVGDLLLGGGRT